jgi:hypothetical protein
MTGDSAAVEARSGGDGGAFRVAVEGDPAAIMADVLDEFADRLPGDAARFRWAAGILRGKPGGRPATAGDEQALAEMAHLIETGVARSAQQAAIFVTSASPTRGRGVTAIDRLRRKYSAKAKNTVGKQVTDTEPRLR